MRFSWFCSFVLKLVGKCVFCLVSVWNWGSIDRGGEGERSVSVGKSVKPIFCVIQSAAATALFHSSHLALLHHPQILSNLEKKSNKWSHHEISQMVMRWHDWFRICSNSLSSPLFPNAAGETEWTALTLLTPSSQREGNIFDVCD